MQITFQAMIFPTLAMLATLILRAYRSLGASLSFFLSVSILIYADRS